MISKNIKIRASKQEAKALATFPTTIAKLFTTYRFTNSEKPSAKFSSWSKDYFVILLFCQDFKQELELGCLLQNLDRSSTKLEKKNPKTLLPFLKVTR
jgi:hypothetical protein